METKQAPSGEFSHGGTVISTGITEAGLVANGTVDK